MRGELIIFFLCAVTVIAIGCFFKRKAVMVQSPTRREVNLIVYFYSAVFIALCYGISFFKEHLCNS